MNITERIEEMATVAEACKNTAENCGGMASLYGPSNTESMILVTQSQILVAQGVILRNLGLNLARETGGS